MTPEEKELTEKNLLSNKEELSFHQYLVKEKTLYLEEGFDIMLRQKKMEIEGVIKEANARIEQLLFAIEATEKTLKGEQ